jgi:hypothetical protein
MVEQDPDLWDRVSYLPGEDYIERYIPNNMRDEFISKTGLKRQLRNPDDLTPEDIEAIKPYAYEGKKVKALTVKLAKDEE